MYMHTDAYCSFGAQATELLATMRQRAVSVSAETAGEALGARPRFRGVELVCLLLILY